MLEPILSGQEGTPGEARDTAELLATELAPVLAGKRASPEEELLPVEERAGILGAGRANKLSRNESFARSSESPVAWPTVSSE